MISLTVKLDTHLMDILKQGKKKLSKSEWIHLCKSYDIEELTEYPLFKDQTMDEKEVESLNTTINYLATHLNESIQHITKYFPDTPHDIEHNLTVSFLPNGKTNYGPKPTLQLFSIFPDAHPYETYLFLIHVYYHEVSFINYTEYCKECAEDPSTPEKLKYFILTLIQNEGIGNYAILKELINFKEENPNYEFKYFTYANQLRSELKISQALGLLRQIFNEMNTDNFMEYRKKINLILKNKQLPIINLVGTHMAEVIAAEFGLESLKNVYHKSSVNFFNTYFKTNDSLKNRLLINSEGNSYFKEIITQ